MFMYMLCFQQMVLECCCVDKVDSSLVMFSEALLLKLKHIRILAITPCVSH